MVWNWRDSLTKNSTISTPISVESADGLQANNPLLNAIQAPACIVNAQFLVIAANSEILSQWPNLKNNELLTLYIRTPLFIETLTQARDLCVSKSVTFTKKQEFDRILQCEISPILQGETPNFLVLFRDLTAATKIEQMRVDFVANASHELKTPIAAILGFIETIQGPAKNDSKASEKFLGIMHTQAKRMARLVDDLLSLSKMELLEHVPVQDAVNFSDILNEVINSLSALAEHSNITLRMKNTAHTVNVLGDKDALFRMVENILSNAIKYGEGGEYIDITLENDGVLPKSHDLARAALSREVYPNVEANASQHLVLKIQDYGIGISSDHLPRLTERFYRVDEARSREKGGTGLGLAIVKHCINRHKGTLKFESELGKGMKVEIVLPHKT